MEARHLICKFNSLDCLQEDGFAGEEAEAAAASGGGGMKAALLLLAAAALLHAQQLQMWRTAWQLCRSALQLWRSLRRATSPLPADLRACVDSLGDNVERALNRSLPT
ncbi:uncharacterized protein LOC134535283 [Bacillus rossius redtenbacheri]|uniref:uncharacterized protein LOC134535283 n=1 Tax=Bacillus rossius redtenbacheri TaxID=93214 RepID=UPI002FDDDF71